MGDEGVALEVEVWRVAVAGPEEPSILQPRGAVTRERVVRGEWEGSGGGGGGGVRGSQTAQLVLHAAHTMRASSLSRPLRASVQYVTAVGGLGKVTAAKCRACTKEAVGRVDLYDEASCTWVAYILFAEHSGRERTNNNSSRHGMGILR